MKFVSHVTYCLSASLALFAAFANAEVELHGFGSIRVGEISGTIENPNIVDLYQENGLNWRDESLFGLQSNVDLSEDLSFNTQLIGKGINDFDPEVTLAFARYQISPDQQLRFGRVSMPLFSQTDVQYVGYAHDYARLPKATYWRFEFETVDGLSYEAKHALGDFTARYTLIWAEFRGDVFKNVVPDGVEIELQDMRSLSFSLGYQNVELFAGITDANTKGKNIDDFVFSPAVRLAVSNSGADLLSQQSFFQELSVSKDASYKFWGSRWRYEDWKIEYERAIYGILNSIDALTYTQYFAISRRFDDYIFTIHREQYRQNQASPAGLATITNNSLLKIAQQLSIGINEPGYAMNVLSMRYDFAANMAFKADYFRGGSYSHGRFNGFSLGVDFVF